MTEHSLQPIGRLGVEDVQAHVPFVTILPDREPIHGIFLGPPEAGANDDLVVRTKFRGSNYDYSFASLAWLGIVRRETAAEQYAAYTMLDDIESYD